MNEQDGYQVSSPLAFSSVFGKIKELHLSPNGSNRNQGLTQSSWPLVNSQLITNFDEISHNFADDGGARAAGMQAVTVVPDFQENLDVDLGSSCMDDLMGSSLQTEILDDNMLDDCQFQDLAGRTGISCFGQLENMKNERQTTCYNHTFRTQETTRKDLRLQSHLEPSKPASSLDTKQYRKLAREKLHARDSHMRCRISKGIQDLEKLLPHPAKNQGEVITKSTEYVKQLQLQLKELSQSKLVSETDADPLVSLKGSGFHVPPHLFVEQLKEVFTQMLEENPAAAMELLKSHGLHKVSMAFVKDVLTLRKE